LNLLIVASEIGVQQGDHLGSTLFAFGFYSLTIGP
jgi:hypothetical protein